MGLDMYLKKAKRKIECVTPNEIVLVEDYLDYLLRPSKYESSTFKEWCGKDIEDVDMEIVDAYRGEYQTRYGAWDTEKKYGYLGLFDGVGYWRKANQIHNWFVENVQYGNDDCGIYEVTKDQLEELLDLCYTVQMKSKLVDGKVKNGQRIVNGAWKNIIEDGKVIEDPSVAQELLPASPGFFFGSTEYDQWYMDNINYTIDMIERVLRETDFEHEIVAYRASW